MPDLASSTNPVTEVPAAPSSRALEHFLALLEFETDCWDVHAATESPPFDFVLLDDEPLDARTEGRRQHTLVVEGAVADRRIRSMT